MIIYFIFFALSFLFIGHANKLEKKGLKKYVILELIGLFFLAFLASIRDLSIGTDVNHYVRPVFNTILKYGISDTYYVNIMEPGYVLFNYIVSIITSNFNVFLFILQFFVLFFSYKGIKIISPKHPVLAYIIYILLYYNKSLNVVRQSMSLALTLFSLKYLFGKEKKKFYICIIIAFLFHRTAVIFAFAYPLFYLLKSSNKNAKYITVIFFILAIFLIIFFKDIFLFLVDSGIVPTRYEKYMTYYFNSELNFEIIDLSLNIFVMLIYILFSKCFKQKTEHSNFYFFMLLVDVFCLIIGARYSGANRLGLYFRLPVLLFFLSNFSVFIKEPKNKEIASTILVLVIVITYWLYMYAYVNIGNTVPFIVNGDIF